MPYKLREDRNRCASEWARTHRKQRNEIVRRYKKNCNRMPWRSHDAKRRYGLTYARYVEIKKRPCDICGKKAKKMCVDHRGPATNFNGTHRGVLCQQCNTRLGWFEKRRVEILAYLEKPDAREI